MRSVLATPVDAETSATVERFRQEPAPLLPILHELQARHGWLPEHVLEVVAHDLKMELADLYGVLTFYHFFRLSPEHPEVEICGGPACRLRDEGEAIREAVAPRRSRMLACPGRCDRPTAIREGERFLESCGASLSAARVESPMTNGPVILRNVGIPLAHTLPVAHSRGAWATAQKRLAPERIFAELEAAGLAGRGGAGFPAAAKWRAVAAAPGTPKYVVVNADEGEPGTFKDRVILEHDPHLLLEAMAIAARAVGATIGIVYLRYEYPEALRRLESAIADAEATGLLEGLRFVVRRGAGAYICGEETSLLNSLEGKKPYPRDKPPYPVTNGLFDKPTLISNVETLAAAVRILELGAGAWRALGKNGAPGTKLYSLSGDVVRPGNFEAPFGTTVAELIEMAGGTTDGAPPLAFTMGGLAGGILPGSDADLPLDFDAPKKRGVMLGSGGIVVYRQGRCVVDAVRGAMEFFRDESCGKCFPCRIGSERIVERLDRLAEGKLRGADLAELGEISKVMARMSACGLGIAAPAPLDGLMKHFRAEVDAHARGECAAGACGKRGPAALVPKRELVPSLVH